MKTYKLIDVWVSIFLIILFIAYIPFDRSGFSMAGYFIVGGWQLISMIVHSAGNWYMKKGGSRRMYTNTVIILLAATILGVVIPEIIMLLAVLMLFAAPVMALSYTMICYKEVYVKMERPLAVLK